MTKPIVKPSKAEKKQAFNKLQKLTVPLKLPSEATAQSDTQAPSAPASLPGPPAHH